MHYVFEPGFFASGPVHVALAVGTVVAITSAVVGVFTVTRGQSFAGHSLADIATTGGSGAFLVGVNQFWGYLAFGAGAAAFMEMIGIQRRRGRDVATGVVLGAALGLAALFLYLGTQYSTTTGASFTILFGSIFVLTPSTVPAPAALDADHLHERSGAGAEGQVAPELVDADQERARTPGGGDVGQRVTGERLSPGHGEHPDHG